MLRTAFILSLMCWLMPNTAFASVHNITGMGEKSSYKIEVEGDTATHTLRIGSEHADAICIPRFVRITRCVVDTLGGLLQIRYISRAPNGGEYLMLLIVCAKERQLRQALHIAVNPNAVLQPGVDPTSDTEILGIGSRVIEPTGRFYTPTDVPIFQGIKTVFRTTKPGYLAYGKNWTFNYSALLFVDDAESDKAETRFLNKKYRVLTANGPQPLARNVYHTYITYGNTKYVVLDNVWYKLEGKLLIPLSGCDV